MPRGFKKGPYSDVPTYEGGGVIGSGVCDCCEGAVNVKVNKSGWPYIICTTCGHQIKSQGVASARNVIGQVKTWHEPAKAIALKIAKLEKAEVPKIEKPEEAPPAAPPPAPAPPAPKVAEETKIEEHDKSGLWYE